MSLVLTQSQKLVAKTFNVLVTEWLVTSKEHVAIRNKRQILLIILPVPPILGRGISLSILQKNCS